MASKILKVTNELLEICQQQQPNPSVPKTIESLNDLHSNIFIYLYETICSIDLDDKIININTIDDEINNIQILINSLSTNILNEDLSYLNPRSICQPMLNDLNSIEYLLDIFKCIHEWIYSRLDSMASSTQTASQDKIQNDSCLEKASASVSLLNDNNETNDNEINDDIWKRHLEQLETFEKLHQELEYLSTSSDLNSSNTSAFSYKATNEQASNKKVVTFPDHSLLSKSTSFTNKHEIIRPITNRIERNQIIENKENEQMQSIVRLNNRCPPANYAPKSFIRPAKNVSKQNNLQNPVQKYQAYKKEWSKQNIPGENNHSNLRWWIREKMLEKPKLIKKPLTKRQEWID